MQSEHTLTATARERTGSRYSRRERSAGRLPAVLYGHGQDPVSLSLDAKEAIRLFEAGERVFGLALGGGPEETVLLKDVQFDYLGTNIIHVDLARVDLNEEVESGVEVRLVGSAKGAKRGGAIVTMPVTSITVRCTVAALPDHVDVDVAEVDLGESLTAGEVALPAGLTLVSPATDILIAIAAGKAEEGEGEAEQVESGSAEPELIERKKKEEGEGEGEG